MANKYKRGTILYPKDRKWAGVSIKLDFFTLTSNTWFCTFLTGEEKVPPDSLKIYFTHNNKVYNRGNLPRSFNVEASKGIVGVYISEFQLDTYFTTDDLCNLLYG